MNNIMKILIDTEEKTIKLEDNVNLGEFVKKIKDIVSDWKDYDLLPETITVKEKEYVPYYPYYPCDCWNTSFRQLY